MPACAPHLAAAFARRASTGAALLALGAVSIASIGCAVRQKPTPDQLTDSQIRLDPAMQRRDWDASVASYPNGAVVAGPTEFPFEPKRNQVGPAYYGTDTLTFFTNVFVMPYSLIVTPPWIKQTSYGAIIPPTSTGVQQLPPSPAAPPPKPVHRKAPPPAAPPKATPPRRTTLPPTTRPAHKPAFVPVPSPATQGLPPAIPATRTGATKRPTATTNANSQ